MRHHSVSPLVALPLLPLRTGQEYVHDTWPSPFIAQKALLGYGPQDEETEAQSGEVTCQSHGARMRWRQDLNPGLSAPEACAVDSSEITARKYLL